MKKVEEENFRKLKLLTQRSEFLKDDLKYYERRVKVSASEKNIAQSHVKSVNRENQTLKDRISHLEREVESLTQDLKNK